MLTQIKFGTSVARAVMQLPLANVTGIARFIASSKAQDARLIEAREPAEAAPTSALAWAVWAVARTGKSLAAQSQTVSYQVGSFFPQPEKFPIDAGGEDDVH
jgi:hypothetical protein